MAGTSHRLLALVLGACLSATLVSCQVVRPVGVRTSSVSLYWGREGAWENTTFFNVSLTTDDFDFCSVLLPCFTRPFCTFNSRKWCSKIIPCTTVKATVEANGYMAPVVQVVTAPQPIANLKVTGLTTKQTIKWDNPASTCLRSIAGSVKFGGYYRSIVTLSKDETSFEVDLCMKGTGEVKLMAVGGDGLSDAVSTELNRILGDDAVQITSCPPQGCTDVVIEWKYVPVCPAVAYLQVTMGDVFSINTTDSSNSTTVTDLPLNEKYDTCVEAMDDSHTLLARHCKECGSQPEVVEDMKVINVTATTALIGWSPPLCPTGNDTTYRVSYKASGYNTTANTTFNCTSLKPAASHRVCVSVLHGGVVTDSPTCVTPFTLPSPLPEIQARLYQNTSLFITWMPEAYNPNFKYLVTWEDDLEHSDYTNYVSYTIDGYNETVGPDRVCVQVETRVPVGKTSLETCMEAPYPDFWPAKPDQTNMIIGVSVSAGLAVVVSAVLVVVAKLERKPSRGTRSS